MSAIEEKKNKPSDKSTDFFKCVKIPLKHVLKNPDINLLKNGSENKDETTIGNRQSHYVREHVQKAGGKQYYHGSSINHKKIIEPYFEKFANKYLIDITTYKSLALISASNVKHFPFIYRIFNKKVYIIETSQNGLNALKKKGYLYKFISKKANKHEYNKYYYQTNESIKKYEKTKIINIYTKLKSMKDVIIVPYEYFIQLIINKLPNKKSQFNSDYMWHGSPIDIKNYVKPHYDGFEMISYVYGCLHKSGALLFSVDRWGTDVLWDGYYNYIWTMETEKNAFNIFKNKSGYVYKLDKKQFVEEKYPTYITDKKAKIIEKIKIKNVWQEIKKQKDNVLITYKEFKNHITNYKKHTKYMYNKNELKLIAKTNKEKQSKFLLQTLLESYNIPIYHNKIIIKENAQSLSFPDITIKQTTDIMDLLYLFIHENLHIGVSLPDKEVKNVLRDVKKEFPKWKNIGNEFEVWSKPPWNFNWLSNFTVHIAVIYNSILIMKEIFPREYKGFFYNGESPYKEFEAWLINNSKRVENFLQKHNLLFKWKPKRPENISFPTEEWVQYKEEIDKGKPSYTVRVYKETGKYKKGSIYYHPYIGNIRITRVKKVKNPKKDIPWWDTIPKHFRDEINKYSKGNMEWLEFIKYQ